ncbi:MAG: RNA polymerase sigma factor [Anaerolineales bacterium]|nr:RNA polymerase sigma factor [Anaerolineales bacterium]
MTKPAFAALVERHSAELFAYLFRLTRDEADAQDCLQEAYLRAHRAYGRLDEGANLRAWLYRIATNAAFSHLRRRRREAAWRAPADERWPAADPSPPEQAARRAQLAALAGAVERLPAQQRAALVLRQSQGLSYAETAAALGCSEDAARANVYQALKKLKEVFRDVTQDEI